MKMEISWNRFTNWLTTGKIVYFLGEGANPRKLFYNYVTIKENQVTIKRTDSSPEYIFKKEYNENIEYDNGTFYLITGEAPFFHGIKLTILTIDEIENRMEKTFIFKDGIACVRPEIAKSLISSYKRQSEEWKKEMEVQKRIDTQLNYIEKFLDEHESPDVSPKKVGIIRKFIDLFKF